MKYRTKKRVNDTIKYVELAKKLHRLCGNKSELSGDKPDWQSGNEIEFHHIQGRVGKKIYDPFNIIALTRNEHTEIHKHNTYEKKQELLELVRSIRIQQGFKENQI